MNFGEKIPLTVILSKESFQSEVDAFKNDMSKVEMMDAKAFFDLVHPAWESTVLQLESEEQDYVKKENYAAAGEVAMRIDEIECNTPESLKNG